MYGRLSAFDRFLWDVQKNYERRAITFQLCCKHVKQSERLSTFANLLLSIPKPVTPLLVFLIKTPPYVVNSCMKSYHSSLIPFFTNSKDHIFVYDKTKQIRQENLKKAQKKALYRSQRRK